MKVAATVILFNPDDNLLSRILTYYPSVSLLFIYDNSSIYSSVVSNWANTLTNVYYLHTRTNEGIALRLNQSAKIALENKCDLLLTMDQDSFFDSLIFNKYLQQVKSYSEMATTAMFGVEFQHKESTVNVNSIFYTPVKHLITSGSIVNLNLFKEIGDFDEALFIDDVDWEYCFKALSKGYKIINCNNIFMHHNIGTVSNFRSLKSLKTTPRTLHSNQRIYYMVRNYLYVGKQYHHLFKEEARYRRKTLLNRLKNNFIYGNYKLQLVIYILKAYFDFLNQNMGKFKS